MPVFLYFKMKFRFMHILAYEIHICMNVDIYMLVLKIEYVWLTLTRLKIQLYPC